MGDLNIPEEAQKAIVTAWDEAADAWSQLRPLGVPEGMSQMTRSLMAKAAEDAVAKAAPFVVASELDALADEMDTRPRWAAVTAEDVRARASQLRGEDGWCNCQAVHGTANYPGPWHPKGDNGGCLKFGRAAVLRGEGQQ